MALMVQGENPQPLSHDLQIGTLVTCLQTHGVYVVIHVEGEYATLMPHAGYDQPQQSRMAPRSMLRVEDTRA